MLYKKDIKKSPDMVLEINASVLIEKIKDVR